MIKEYKNYFYKTGRFLQIYSFERPIKFNVKHPLLKKHLDRYKNMSWSEHTPEQIERMRLASGNRAKDSIRRLIYGNMYNYDERPKFITLTFDPKQYSDIQEIGVANHYFTLYRKRLNYSQHKYIPYIAVPERQKNGNWHYHMIAFDLPYITNLLHFQQEVWKYGGTNVKEVNRTRGVTHYITKYISKSFLDPALKGKKRYFSGLKYRPIRTLGTEGLADLLSPFAVKMKLPERQVIIRGETFANGIQTQPNKGVIQEFILNQKV